MKSRNYLSTLIIGVSSILLCSSCYVLTSESGSKGNEMNQRWTGWEKDGLKGKVKEHIEIYYKVQHVKEMESKTISKYDVKGNKTEVTCYNIENANESLLGKDVFKYDNNGNMIEQVRHKADRALAMKIILKYDDKGNQVEEDYYDPYGGSLEGQDIYKYDNKGNRIERIDSISCRKWIYKYDGNGNQIEEVFYEGDGSLSTKLIYKYNDKGKKIECAGYDAKGLTHKLIYKYDDKENQVEECCYNFKIENGALTDKTIWKYDDKGNQIEEEFYQVNYPDIRTKRIYKYDDKGNRTEEGVYYTKGVLSELKTSSYTYY